MDFEIKKLKKFADERGFLVEFLKKDELNKKEFGQIYLPTLEPNCIRGNHYHKTKDEFFTVMAGKFKVILEEVNTKERKEFLIDVDDKELIRIRVGKNVAHVLKNVSDKTAILVAYTTEQYDTDKLDQEAYMLLEK